MKTITVIFLILVALVAPKVSLANTEQSGNKYRFVSDDAIYDLKDEPIDVVIPCHPKDAVILDRCIRGIRANGINIGRIIVVSKVRITEQAEWFPEEAFPFTKDDLLNVIFDHDQTLRNAYASNKNNRTGWMFQQLLKLYAPFVIPDISSNVLILDADAVFLKPITFINPEGGPYLTPTTEYFACYFEHAERLIPNFKRIANISGVAHHMLFQKAILEDLFQTIETAHGMPVWHAVCACVDKDLLFLSPFSEYEIYFNFCLSKTKQAKLRQLLYRNVFSPKAIKDKQKQGYNFVTCHSHERKN